MSRDRRGRSSPPVTAGSAARALAARVAPDTPLGSVQAVWPGVVGDPIAAVTTIISERAGDLEVGCESAVWADELSMMEPQIRDRLNEKLGDQSIKTIKFRAGA